IDLAAIEDAIRIEGAGDCSCPLRTPVRSSAFEICPLGDGTSTFWPTLFAVADDGAIASITQGEAAIYPASGQPVTTPIHPSVRDLDGITAFPGQSSFVASYNLGPRETDGTGLLLMGPNGQVSKIEDQLAGISRIRFVAFEGAHTLTAIGLEFSALL